MKNPIELMAAIHDQGGQLRVVDGVLRMLLPTNAPVALKTEIRSAKAALLDLFAHRFVIVRVDGLGLLCWAADVDAKDALTRNGVDPGIVYLPHELRTLLSRSYTLHDLFAVCSAKSAFDGSIKGQ